MEKAIEKTSGIYEQLKSLTGNIVSLDKKCKELELQMSNCDNNIKNEMDNLKQILSGSFKKEETHLLSKSTLKRISALLEERREIDYALSKYCYHRNKVREKLFSVQEEIKDSSDILSYSR